MTISNLAIAFFAISTTVVGAAYAISRIGVQAIESIARQPEASTPIRNVMLVVCGFIEGLGLIGCVLCYVLA